LVHISKKVLQIVNTDADIYKIAANIAVFNRVEYRLCLEGQFMNCPSCLLFQRMANFPLSQ
ncbi:MAG TPA: hypothetical protein VIQ31_30730, partial [Phormidium sp.]